MMRNSEDTIAKERWASAGLFLPLVPAIVLVAAILRGPGSWHTSREYHTLEEMAGTLLALVTGVMVLVRFYSRKNNALLFVGAGLFGAGLLDAYHTLVTSSFMAGKLPSDLPSLIPWSWSASRLFLSLCLWLSWWGWKREVSAGQRGRIPEKGIYAVAGLLLVATFAFFAFSPLPKAEQPGILFHRPQEFIPAALFLAAFVGYFRKDERRYDTLDYWITLSLMTGFLGQVFMSFSGKLFDPMFELAHQTKIIGYLLVLIGSWIDMYKLFARVEMAVQMALQANDALKVEIAKRG